ncbi:MAG TPA: glycosyltransferase family 39 protein [Candidatus Acidoferrales bacterium]|nr:glycosyltransferase family 39 protein [Candidatus Acidoferrales bacterium]
MESLVQKLAARPQRSILVLGLILLLAGNWILPLTDRDETRFAEASREMIQRGDYVVPWFNGHWRFDKPVLIYWCQAASYRVLGVNGFAARLPSVLFTTATALLLARWARKVADARTAFMAGAMFLASLHVAIIGRVATADMAMVFFFTLAVWSGWELTRPENPFRKTWWWTFYVAIALGFLAKGPEAALPVGGLVLGRVLRKNSFRLPPADTVVGLCVAGALMAMWGIPALAQTHGQYWNVGMGEHVFHRSTAVNDGHGLAGMLGFAALLPLYFLTFFASFLPWSTRVPTALRRWWISGRADDLGWYLLAQALIVFAVFSCVRTKLPHYTLPAFPCVALWLAWQLRSQEDAFSWFQKRLVVMVILVLVLMLGFTPLVRKELLTERLWAAVEPYVRADTKVACYGFTESSLVWKFRTVVTNTVTLGEERNARNFLTNSPPFILVLPTREAAALGDAAGRRIQVHGFDLVRFKNWDLTAIIRQN